MIVLLFGGIKCHCHVNGLGILLYSFTGNCIYTGDFSMFAFSFAFLKWTEAVY